MSEFTMTMIFIGIGIGGGAWMLYATKRDQMGRMTNAELENAIRACHVYGEDPAIYVSEQKRREPKAVKKGGEYEYL